MTRSGDLSNWPIAGLSFDWTCKSTIGDNIDIRREKIKNFRFERRLFGRYRIIQSAAPSEV